MSLNPLNELKRRLDDDKTPMPKRLCLAKNIVQSHHFPTAPKERIVAEWLNALAEGNKLKSEELKSILNWLSAVDDLTSDLKCKFIQIVSKFIQNNPLQASDIEYISSFLDNSKISSQLNIQIDEYLNITIILLQNLRNNTNTQLSKKLLLNIIKYYRESKKKLEFILKFLEGDNLETVFSYLDTDCRDSVLEICKYILFPTYKRTYFISFLQTLIRKDNLEELISEKGDNIQSVIKIMNAFFEFPKNRTDNNVQFLNNFIDVFVSSFQKENQIIFAFYIMVTNVLNMEQKFITPAMTLPPIFSENNAKTKRNLFLNMLEVLLTNEIDINVRLTDTFGEKISKVEIKKNFMSFLQAVMMRQLKLEGKLDKTTLQIIKTALKLDPVLVEPKINLILPPIMTAKKNNAYILELYVEMMNCLLEMLFKLSRGTLFINKILPTVKDILETSNTEQFQLKQQVEECKLNGTVYDKIESKIITGADLFPSECIAMYGKLTSELMFRQNKELLESLQRNLEVNCLMMLEEGFVSPSIIILTEVLSSILATFLEHNKMADHTVPLNIAEDFWDVYKKFEIETLRKFGECVLKLNYNPPLILNFLKLCESYAQLKLLNVKYSNVKLDISISNTLELTDLSFLLPCLETQQWMALAAKIKDYEAVIVLDKLLLAKSMAIELLTNANQLQSPIETVITTKMHLLSHIKSNPSLLQNNYFCKTLFSNLDISNLKPLAKTIVKLYLDEQETEILNIEAFNSNRNLLNAIVVETAKNITKCFEHGETLTKAIGKSEFNIILFVKELDIQEYFNSITLKQEHQDVLKNCVNILKQLPIHNLEENYQLVAIFVMLAIKKCSQQKKVKRNVDYILQSIYELSFQRPDLYQIFPVDFIFNFNDGTLLDLLTLKIKTSNNMLIIKNLLELAVKKVRIDSEQLRNIVERLLKKNCNKLKNDESFSDPIFQITCLILPLIVKQKKIITASAFRSILTDLQEKLNTSLLNSFKRLDFSSANTEDHKNNDVAILNAMAAYSLILSKYCETTDSEEIKNLDCLWLGLEFYTQNAIKCLENPELNLQHIESSIQLLNVILRHTKKLETHSIFTKKDKILLQIWRSVKTRLSFENQNVENSSFLEDVGVTLKFVCELASVECFSTHFIGDLGNLVVLKKPSMINDTSDIKSRQVFKYLWSQALNANIVGQKCVAMAKLMLRTCKNLRNWMRQHYEGESVARFNSEISTEEQIGKIVKIDDICCKLIKLDLDSLSEILLAAKKVSLDYKFLDIIFELQHLVHYVLGTNSITKCEISMDAYVELFEGCVLVLNALLVAREETIEDRWPCYMQCYRALTTSLCERASTHAPDNTAVEDRLAELAHNIEKLTQSISKRKKHVSRIAAYTVADLCTLLERNAPHKNVRQHIENSVALLIQASDSSYAMAFLKRALVGTAGQMTMTNLYTMYKRYHKYVGNC